MAVNRSIQEILASIRTAIFGKDVRESIAEGIEKCYDDAVQISVKKYNGVFYISDNGSANWTNLGNASTVLSLGSDNYMYRANGSTYEISISSILTAAQSSSYISSVDTTNKKITGNTYAILFNPENNSVIITSGQDYTNISKYPIIFCTHYGSVRAGLLVDYMLEKRAEIAENDISKKKYNGVFYIADNGSANWTNLGGAPTVLSLGSDNYIYRANGSNYEIPISSIITAAQSSSYISSVDTTNKKITGNTYAILFNPENNSVIITSGQDYTNISKYPIIFCTHYGSIRAGLLIDYMLEKRVEDISDGISVPSYYKTHIDSAVSTIMSNMMDVGNNGETFIFITDTHWESNRKNSPALVKYLLKNLNINVLLCGGDLFNEGERAPMIENARKAIASFSPFNNVIMPCAFGNHDSNWNNWNHQHDYPERYFDRKDQYALMQKQAENLVTYISSNAWNFYFDVPNTKTRFIVIDTGEDGVFSNYSDLATCMLAAPTGYHIVIMGHWLYNDGVSTSCTNIMSMIDTYNSKTSVTISSQTYNFSSANGTVNLLLGGHMHNDMSWTTTGGVPVVLTDCDAGARSDNTDYPYVAGTITEQAFDVFTIDYLTGNIKAVRIGRGANRTWNRT